jgi:hypothetical protein
MTNIVARLVASLIHGLCVCVDMYVYYVFMPCIHDKYWRSLVCELDSWSVCLRMYVSMYTMYVSMYT